MTKSKARRLILQKVDVLSVTEEGRLYTQAKVILASGDQRFVGRATVTADDEDMVQATAQATLAALLAALPPGTQLTLKATSRLRPPFLNDPLLVAIIDAAYEDLELHLTGACVTKEEKLLVGVASAILDATNRFVSFLLDIYSQIEVAD